MVVYPHLVFGDPPLQPAAIAALADQVQRLRPVGLANTWAFKLHLYDTAFLVHYTEYEVVLTGGPGLAWTADLADWYDLTDPQWAAKWADLPPEQQVAMCLASEVI